MLCALSASPSPKWISHPFSCPESRMSLQPLLSESWSVQAPTTQATAPAHSSVATKRGQPAHPSESPAKKQSKWSGEEEALIIELRGSGMKWEEISKRRPGRSAISCRLHYQNYLERRSEWDEERKNKLARLYERQAITLLVVKPTMLLRLLPGTTLEEKFRRRNAAINVVAAYCNFREGELLPPDHIGSSLLQG